MASLDEKLKDILSKVLLIDKQQISDELSRKTVKEWDSMAHLMIVSEIESVFDVTMEDEDIMEIQTVADIKKTLEKLGFNKSNC